MYILSGVCVILNVLFVTWLQNVADLGSGLQSAQQRQLGVVQRLDALAQGCSTLNDSVSSFDDMITSLNVRLSGMQATVNETLVCCSCSFARNFCQLV